jgi:predicted peroxiredoxin
VIEWPVALFAVGKGVRIFKLKIQEKMNLILFFNDLIATIKTLVVRKIQSVSRGRFSIFAFWLQISHVSSRG